MRSKSGICVEVWPLAILHYRCPRPRYTGCVSTDRLFVFARRVADPPGQHTERCLSAAVITASARRVVTGFLPDAMLCGGAGTMVNTGARLPARPRPLALSLTLPSSSPKPRDKPRRHAEDVCDDTNGVQRIDGNMEMVSCSPFAVDHGASGVMSVCIMLSRITSRYVPANAPEAAAGKPIASGEFNQATRWRRNSRFQRRSTGRHNGGAIGMTNRPMAVAPT